MRKTFLYILGGQLATISIPVIAQEAAPDTVPEAIGGGALTPEQLTAFESWPSDRQARYEAWPSEVQAYFWTVPQERREHFWMLTDKDRQSLVAMDFATREQAWSIIEKRMSMPADRMQTMPGPEEPAETPEPEGR